MVYEILMDYTWLMKLKLMFNYKLKFLDNESYFKKHEKVLKIVVESNKSTQKWICGGIA